jgi:hypothetical protein
MAIVTQFIKRNQFYGAEKIFSRESDGLTRLMRGLARTQAQIALNSKLTAMVDNSGGTPYAGSIVPLIQTSFTGITQTGSNAVSKAAMETAFTAVTQAIADLAAQLVLVNGVVQVYPASTFLNNTGLVGVGTIAAIPQAFTGVNASEAQVVGSSALLLGALNALNLLITVANSFVPCVIGESRVAANGQSAVFPAPTLAVPFTLTNPDLPGYLITNNLGLGDSFMTSAGFPAMSLTTGSVSDGVALSQVATTEAASVFASLANVIATVRQTVNNLRTLTYPLPVAAIG